MDVPSPSRPRPAAGPARIQADSNPKQRTAPAGELQEHVEDTVATIAEVYRAHDQTTSTPQRLIDHLTGIIGRPAFVAALAAGITAWIAGNIIAPLLGNGAIDPPPFIWLECASTITALLMAVLIVSTQRREDRLAEQRAELTLGLALLSERKSAKIIALLEELRRDIPGIDRRLDQESQAMSKASDPGAVLAAIEGRNAERASARQGGQRDG